MKYRHLDVVPNGSILSENIAFAIYAFKLVHFIILQKFVDGFKRKTEFYDELWKDRVVLYNEFLFWQLIREGGRSDA